MVGLQSSAILFARVRPAAVHGKAYVQAERVKGVVIKTLSSRLSKAVNKEDDPTKVILKQILA